MMEPIQTNRDLYLAVAALIGRHRDTTRTLEEYLLALWALAQTYRDRPALSMNEFFGLLADAFTAAVHSFNEDWRTAVYDDLQYSGFRGWETRVQEQVVDLHEMRERGILKQELLYFGTDSPRGSRWYNFDPCTFLECATAGTFDGWEPGDNTGRDFVPGPVAVLGDDGRVTSRDPHDLLRPVSPIDEVSWDQFRSFLDSGQLYE
jgi:hypothetical protein